MSARSHARSRAVLLATAALVLSNGAPGQWGVGPGPVDGVFGARAVASVRAFQRWGGQRRRGRGCQTWAVSLHAPSATLETAVGLRLVRG